MLYKLNYSQRNKIKQLKEFINRKDQVCYHILKNKGWNIQNAMNEFFDNEWKYPVDPRDRPKVDKNKILKDFKSLSKDGKTINFKELIPALGLDQKDLAIIVFAYKCKSAKYGELTKKEYTDGLTLLGYNNSQELNKGMAKFRKTHFSSDEQFQKVYVWSYQYYNLTGTTNIKWKYVMKMWEVFFANRLNDYPMYPIWKQFMEKRKAECKKEKSNSYHNDVTPDNWRMLLEFFLDIKQGSTSHGYSTYAFDISYPVIFEDFQDYLVELKLAEEQGEDEDYNTIYKLKLG